MAYYLSVTAAPTRPADNLSCVTIAWALLDDARPGTVFKVGTNTLSYGPIETADVMGQPLSDQARRELFIYGPLLQLAAQEIARAQAADIDHPVVVESLTNFRYPPAS